MSYIFTPSQMKTLDENTINCFGLPARILMENAGKGCADLLASSYRNSYFNIQEYKKSHKTLLATCRAGNVIGGGDWAQDRLMTDIMLSVSQAKKVSIRSPKATRP